MLTKIHVWDLKTGKQLNAPLQSVGQPIWNVRWTEDGKAIRYAKHSFKRSYLTGGQYHYNNYGALDTELNLSRWTITNGSFGYQPQPIYPKFGQFTIVPQRNEKTKDVEDAVGGCRYGGCGTFAEDWKFGMFDLFAEQADGSKINLHPLHDVERLYLARYIHQLPHPTQFGRPMCFATMTYAGSTKESLIIGTQNGELVECEIVQGPNPEKGGNPLPELRIRRHFIGHTAMVTSISQSPDRSLLASSSLDGTIRIWKLNTPRILGDVDFLVDGSHVEFVPDGSYAMQTGLKRGDALLSFGSTSFYERMSNIAKGVYRPGDVVEMEYKTTATFRDENGNEQVKFDESGEPVLERRTTKITLAEAPDIVEPMLSFFVARDGEWVAWTQQGYYEASADGARYVGWHLNQSRQDQASFYRLDQFQQQLNQRRIIRNVLPLRSAEMAADTVLKELAALPDPPATIQIANYADFSRTVPPKVRILSPEAGQLMRYEDVVRAEFISPVDQPVTEVVIRVGGRNIPVRAVLSEKSDAAGIRTEVFEYPVEFGPGDETISLTAKNSIGLTDSDTVGIRVKSQTIIEPESNLYVLSIGISKCADERFNLRYADQDAEKFSAVWQQQKGRLYANVVVKTLVNEQATVLEIKKGAQWLQKQALRGKDVALVFLSGHGVYDDSDTWYFLAHDSNPEDIAITGISHAELSLAFRKVSSPLVLFADTCHSGAFNVIEGAKAIGVRQNNIWQDSGKITFASCLPEENSFENDVWKSGAFAKAIIESLDPANDADSDGDKKLDIDEMKKFVLKRVSDLTGDKQHPNAFVPPFVGIPEMAKF
ncbi:MAG: caspase family protein [Planctomycetaceae bacterium]